MPVIRRSIRPIDTIMNEFENLPLVIPCIGIVNEKIYYANPRIASDNLFYGDIVDANAIMRVCGLEGHNKLIEPEAEYIGMETSENGKMKGSRLIFRMSNIAKRDIYFDDAHTDRLVHHGIIIYSIGSGLSRNAAELVKEYVFHGRTDLFQYRESNR